ncbi:MAG: Y-family DNA polymerase, partial [Candidatus Adiutrix sp.]
GVASQKHLAKIASGLNKPNGLTVVREGGELEFLWPLSLNKLWGVGAVTLKKLHSFGLKTVGDLAALEQSFLVTQFGQSGGQLWRLANGIDPREVTPHNEIKSISSETTFPQDLNKAADIKAALLGQSLKAVERLRQSGFLAKTVTVKFRDGTFKTKTRAKTLKAPSNLRDLIYQTVLAIYEEEKTALKPMRLLGVALSQLVSSAPEEAPPKNLPPRQLSLFDEAPSPSTATVNQPKPCASDKTKKLNLALDTLSQRFGENTVIPATLAKKGNRGA